MNPGSTGTPGFKICPVCNTQSRLEENVCSRCGHQFRQVFTTPPPNQPFVQPPNPTMGFPANPVQPIVSPDILVEMARQFNEAKKVVIWTFWLGLFCLWPLWIVTYLEYTKMNRVKEQVALMGVNVQWWQTAYRATNVI
jgi:hypothetical protein